MKENEPKFGQRYIKFGRHFTGCVKELTETINSFELMFSLPE